MKDKLITGAATYRRQNGKTQWLIVKEIPEGNWELPKDFVRKGESSVSRAIRSLREDVGLRAKILEEAGRATVSTTENGEPLAQKQIFYLARQGGVEPKSNHHLEGKWAPYSYARRSLSLAREKRILRQANETLKVWRKTKRDL